MRVVALISLAESVLSLLGSTYLAARCSAHLSESDAFDQASQRRRSLTLILLMIGVADLFA